MRRRKRRYIKPVMLEDILKQQEAAQHLQEQRRLNQDLQNRNLERAKEKELLRPLIWNHETGQYEIAVWDKEEHKWRLPG